jgi:RNA polymerase sigma-70 factor (TIGR02960 family)
LWSRKVYWLKPSPIVLDGTTAAKSELLEAARRGDAAAFDRLVAPYRSELHAHCYRMLGSVQDAEDALQDALLGAWRGLPGFEGRSSLRSWLYRITTNACVKLGQRRPKRLLAKDYRSAADDVHELGEWVTEAVWLKPFPESKLVGAASPEEPEARYELRESVELAFVAALQFLPATQRAVLILRDVLAFSAAEVATLLETSVTSVNSALQRARKGLDQRMPEKSQQATLRALGESRRRELVESFVAAWERADVPAILDMLVEDARFTMPPFPAWFQGRDAISRFMTERMFETPWRLVPISASGQLAFACYQGTPEGPPFRLGAINVLTLRGEKIVEISAFLDPKVHAQFELPEELA